MANGVEGGLVGLAGRERVVDVALQDQAGDLHFRRLGARFAQARGRPRRPPGLSCVRRLKISPSPNGSAVDHRVSRSSTLAKTKVCPPGSPRCVGAGSPSAVAVEEPRKPVARSISQRLDWPALISSSRTGRRARSPSGGRERQVAHPVRLEPGPRREPRLMRLER